MTTHQIGVGGVGFWVAVALMRAAIPDLVVYDTDTLEGGMGHMRVPRASPTTKKTALLRGFTAAVMGDSSPKIVDAKFTGVEVEAGDLVVDCSDMPLIGRRVMWKIAQEQGARCIRVSYDGRNQTVVVAEGLPLVGRPQGGYAEVPDLALSFMAGGIGALVVQKILTGHEHYVDFQISLNDHLKDWTKHDQNPNGEELPAQSEE